MPFYKQITCLPAGFFIKCALRATRNLNHCKILRTIELISESLSFWKFGASQQCWSYSTCCYLLSVICLSVTVRDYAFLIVPLLYI